MNINNLLGLDDMQFQNMLVYKPTENFLQSEFSDWRNDFHGKIFLMVDARFIRKRSLGSFFDWSTGRELAEIHRLNDSVCARGFDVFDGERFKSYILDSDDKDLKQWDLFDKDEFIRKIESLEGRPYNYSPVGDRLFFTKENAELGQWPKAQIWVGEEVGPKLGMVWFS